MRIGELLRKKKKTDVITAAPDHDIAHAVDLLLRHGIGGVPVVSDAGDLVGFAAERDLLKALHLDPDTDEGMRIARVMRAPAPTADIGDELQDAMARMTRERVRHLVVTEGNRIAGVLSVGDIVKHRLEQLETETGVLRDYVTAQRAAGTGAD